MAAVASHSFRIKYGWYLQALFKEWSGTNTLVRASNLFHLSSPLSSYASFCNDAPPPDGTITTSCCDHSIDRGPSPWTVVPPSSRTGYRDREFTGFKTFLLEATSISTYTPWKCAVALPKISRSEEDLYVRLRHPQFAHLTTRK